jgi:hypothetical protein
MTERSPDWLAVIMDGFSQEGVGLEAGGACWPHGSTEALERSRIPLPEQKNSGAQSRLFLFFPVQPSPL